MKLTHTGTVIDGMFVADNAEFYKWDISCYEGKRIELSIKTTTRTLPQNAYYWGVIVRMFVDYFNREKILGRVVDKEAVHEILKFKFLGIEKTKMANGEVIEKPNTSKELDVSEFSDYVSYCMQWGHDMFGLRFPEAETKMRMK